MNPSPKMPVVAIVGRPNVGKSSLLNALTHRLISIVQDMPGVTRDRVSTPLAIGEHYVELVDTGGYGFEDPDHLTEHIRHQIELAMNRADLVLLIVDCQDGRTTADEQIASLLRKKSIKTLLVANKADGPKIDSVLGDFARLGLGTPLGISALHKRNIEQLLQAIGSNVDMSNAPTEVPPPQMLTAIVGKRNAGKSTLVNAIAETYEGHSDRVIVSEVPGTTRDSIDVRFEKDGKALLVIDTAGVRKKRHMVTNDIEFYSFHRAQRSIRRADVVLMLIDATETISEPDKKLAQYIAEEFKPVVLVVNKWDLARQTAREQLTDPGASLRDEDLMEQYRKYVDQELHHLSFAPLAFVTAKDHRNVQQVLDLAQHLYNQANLRLTTAKLNQVVRQILEERLPSTTGGARARVYYATQTAVEPPTIVMFVNNPDYFSQTYRRYILNRFRDLLPYAQVPIKLLIRQRTQRAPSASPHAESEHGAATPLRVASPARSPRSRAVKPARPKGKQRRH